MKGEERLKLVSLYFIYAMNDKIKQMYLVSLYFIFMLSMLKQIKCTEKVRRLFDLTSSCGDCN